MGLIAIQVDSREPATIQKLRFGGVDKVIVELDAGDLLGVCDDATMIAVERKTPSDLLNTLRDQRLFPQLTKLRAVTPWAYLVVCGGLYPAANDKVWFDDGSAMGSRETGWTWSSVQGALLTCQEIGVNVVFANGLLDYEATVTRLANRDRSTLKVTPARDASFLSSYETILAALPQVGPERAKALLEVCGTPAMALNFLTDLTWKEPKVPGVGQGLKRLIRHELGLEDGQGLVVLADVDAPLADLTANQEPAHQLEEVAA